jgi:hypothetical protein
MLPFKDLTNPVIGLIHVLFCGIGEYFTIDGEALCAHNLRILEIFPKNQYHAQVGVKMAF